MEKRVLLAAVLSAVVLLMWYAFVAPPPPKPQGPDGGEAVATAAPATTAAAGETTAAEESATPPDGAAAAEAVPENAPEAVHGEVGEEIEVRGDRVTATVSSVGGVISSLVVEGYKNYRGEPMQLVDDQGTQPLAMAADGPWNHEVYAVERTADGVRLRWSDGRGDWVEKLVESSGTPFGLSVRVEAGGKPAVSGVVVATSVRPGQGAAEARFARADAVLGVDGDLERVNPAKLKSPEMFSGSVAYAGTESQYFLEVLLPESPIERAEVESAGTKEQPAATVAVVGGPEGVAGTLFAGPKEHETLVAYGRGLDDTLSFGIFGVLSVAFLAALRWIHAWTANWGVAIIVLTAAIRVVLFPLTHKSTVAMRRMQKLQPKMKAIQARYQDRAKKDPAARTRMNQEIMGLYKQEGVNPMGGCLPTLVQLPILWALYTLFAYAIELRQAPFMLWIHDLSVKDPTYVLPILMMISMFVQQRLAPQTGDPTQRRMFMMMPLIFGFMFMSFPAGLVLYWLVNNLLTIGQQLATEAIMKRSAATA